jgi:hypothetical protein
MGSLGLRTAGVLGGFGLRGAGAFGGVVGRYPVIAGGVAVFCAIFGSVAANALWYQTGVHPSPILRTRDPNSPYQIPGRRPFLRAQQADAGNVTTFRIERQATPDANAASARSAAAPATAAVVQAAVPATSDGASPKAGGGKAAKAVTAGIPTERPVVKVSAGDQTVDPVAVAIQSAEKDMRSGAAPRPPPSEVASKINIVTQIQKGLSNIAYTNVSIDGIAGDQTRAAIRRFQKHYRLPETGEPEMAVLKKLQDIGAL